MDRRTFLATASALPLMAEAGREPSGQNQSPRLRYLRQHPRVESPVEKMTAAPSDTVALCHVGFKPEAKKILIARWGAEPLPTHYHLAALDRGPLQITRSLTRVNSDLGTFLTADFSDCELYRATQAPAHRHKVIELGQELLRRQNRSFIANQRLIRGFLD